MKIKSILWLALISMSLSLFARPEAGSIQFYEGSFTQLRAEAQSSRTPYFIYFYRLDCAPCRKMGKETFNFNPLVEYSSQNYFAFKADVEEFTGTDLAYLYRVKEIPSIIILGPDGDVRERVIGFLKGPELLRKLNSNRRDSDGNASSRVTAARTTQRDYYRTSQPDTKPSGERSYFRDVTYNSDPSYKQRDMLSTQDQTVGEQRGMQETDRNYRPEVKDGNYLDSYRNYMSRRYGEQDRFAGNNSGGSDQASQKKQASKYSGDQPAWAYGEDDYQEKERGRQQEARANGSQRGGRTPYKTDFRSNDPNNFDPSLSSYPSSNDYGSARGADHKQNQGQTYQQNQGQAYQQDEARAPSFLDPMEAVGNRPEYVWVEDRRVRTSNLPSGTSFYQAEDGEWYAGSKVESYNAPSNTAYRAANDKPQAQQKDVHLLVPGFGQYSPQQVTDNTYALEVGSYTTFGELRSAIREVKQYNDSPLWVYSEEVNNKHQYKLVMGAFRSENDAASDAIRKGASWQHIKVVNLAGLK